MSGVVRCHGLFKDEAFEEREVSVTDCENGLHHAPLVVSQVPEDQTVPISGEPVPTKVSMPRVATL